MKRVLFGNERRLEIIANRCPDCNVARGQEHEYGCVLETCPQCGGRLLHCTCKALSIIDGLRISRAISSGITDKAEIHRALEHGSAHLDRTYYEEGVMMWIMDDVTARDPEAARKADEYIKDMGFVKTGNGYAVSAENVADHMDISIDEAHEVLAGLQADSLCPEWERSAGSVQ